MNVLLVEILGVVDGGLLIVTFAVLNLAQFLEFLLRRRRRCHLFFFFPAVATAAVAAVVFLQWLGWLAKM